MKKLIVISTISLLLTLAAIASFGQSAQRNNRGGSETADAQWEYLVVSGGNLNLSSTGGNMRKQPEGAFSREAFVLEQSMDKLGAKGWELVAVTGNPNDPMLYFKRPKETR
jgi:hypothetical protein